MEKELVFRIIVKGEAEKTAALNKLQVELTQTTARIKELQTIQVKGGTISQAERAELNGLISKQSELKSQVGQLSTAINNEAKVTTSATSSIAQLRAETSLMIQKAGQMTVTTKQEEAARQKLVTQIQKNQTEIRNFDRSISGSSTLVGEYEKGFTGAFKNIGVAIAGVMATYLSFNALQNSIGGSVKAYAELETGVTNVQTLLDKQDSTLQGRTLELVKKYGLEIKDVTKAYFDTVSAGYSVEKANEVLNQSSMLAVAGVTELKVATDGMTSIMNTYSLGMGDAEQVASSFFTAQKYGKTTVAQLAESIGSVAPIARMAGVSFQELMSALSEMTNSGLKTDMAAMALKNTLNAIMAPSKQAKEKFDELGISTGVVAIKEQGLGKILLQISQAVKQDEDALTELIPNIRALLGVSSMGEEQLKRYNEILTMVNSDYGEGSSLVKGYEMQMDTLNKRWDITKATISEVGISFAEELRPALVSVMGVFSNLFEWIGKHSEGLIKLAKIIGLVGGATLLYKTYLMAKNSLTIASIALTKGLTIAQAQEGAVMKGNTIVAGAILAVKKAWNFTTGLLTGSIKTATVAQQGFNAAQKANPAGLIITAITTIIGLFTIFSSKANAAKKAQNELNEIQLRSHEIVIEQKTQIDLLTDTINNETLSEGQRLDALKKLQEISPEYFKNLDLEAFKTNTAKEAIDNYLKSLEKQAKAKSLEEVITNAGKKIDELNVKGAERSWISKQVSEIKGLANGVGIANQKAIDGIMATNEAINEQQVLIDKAKEDYQKLILGEIPTSTEKIDPLDKLIKDNEKQLEGTEGLVKAENDAFQKRLQEYKLFGIEKSQMTDKQRQAFEILEKQHEERLAKIQDEGGEKRKDSKGKLKQKEFDVEKALNEARLNNIANNTAREIAIEANRHDEQVKIYQKEVTDKTQLTELLILEDEKYLQNTLKTLGSYDILTQKSVLKEKENFDKGLINRENYVNNVTDIIQTAEYIDILEKLADTELKNLQKATEDELKVEKDRYDKGEISLEEYQKRVIDINKIASQVKEFAAKQDTERIKKAFDRETLLRSTAFKLEYAALGDDEKAKAALKKKYEDEELARQKKFYEDQVKLYQDKLTLGTKQEIESVEMVGGEAIIKYKTVDLTDEEKADLQAKIDNAGKDLSGIEVKIGEGKEKKNAFGMTEAETKGLQDKVEKYSGYIGQLKDIWASFDQIRANKEQAAFNKWEANSNKQKADLKKRLDSGAMSQKDYDKQIAAIEAEAEKRKRQIAYDEAKRAKKQAIFEILISTAVGIAKAIPNIFEMALAAVVGGLQLAAVASQPLPELKKGGKVNNEDITTYITKINKVARGSIIQGIGAWDSDNQLVRVSPKEAILNARSLAEKDTYTMTGTPVQIASQINTLKGYGIPFASYGKAPTQKTIIDNTVSIDVIRQIVNETVSGIVSIPVNVYENDITQTQRLVEVSTHAGDI